jgi:MerR family transcriptional regulator, redox-sensitive transcriptional activator SoxR
MRIGQLARSAGLNASAIRYYERRGLLAPTQRKGGQRRYATDAVSRVLLIRFATEMGFTLNEIKLFLAGIRDNTPVGPRWRKLATRKLIEVNQNVARSLQLRSLLQGLLHCHCPTLQFCLNRLRLSPKLHRLESIRTKRW